MYEILDKTLPTINKLFIREFEKIKGLMNFDELNVLQATDELYKKVDKQSRQYLLLLARDTYDSDTITDMWLLGFLSLYNPVTKYVYTHEVDRKRSRTAEAIIASPTKGKEIDKALRYWADMIKQYGIDVIDEATIQAYKDKGVKRVMWNTEQDTRVCKTCQDRDGKIYDIYKLPPKPHWGCRCYFTPVRKG